MRGAIPIRGSINKLGSTLVSFWRAPEFTCGDCERWTRCGMSSSEDCIFKVEQIARGDWQTKRLTKALGLVTGWPKSSG